MCCNSPRQASSWKPATTANCASKWDFRKFHPSVEWFLRVRSLRSKSQTLCGSILIVFCVAFFNSAGILCRVLFLLVGPDIWPRTRLWFYACLKSEGDVALCADTWLCSCPPICSHCLERTFLSSLVNSVTWSGLSSGTLPLSCSIDYVSIGGDLTLLPELRPNWQAEEEWVLGLQNTSAALWMKSLVSLKQKR